MKEELKKLRKNQKAVQDAWKYTFNCILRRLVAEKYPELFKEVQMLTNEEIKNHPKYKEVGLQKVIK